MVVLQQEVNGLALSFLVLGVLVRVNAQSLDGACVDNDVDTQQAGRRDELGVTSPSARLTQSRTVLDHALAGDKRLEEGLLKIDKVHETATQLQVTTLMAVELVAQRSEEGVAVLADRGHVPAQPRVLALILLVREPVGVLGRDAAVRHERVVVLDAGCVGFSSCELAVRDLRRLADAVGVGATARAAITVASVTAEPRERHCSRRH